MRSCLFVFYLILFFITACLFVFYRPFQFFLFIGPFSTPPPKQLLLYTCMYIIANFYLWITCDLYSYSTPFSLSLLFMIIYTFVPYIICYNICKFISIPVVLSQYVLFAPSTSTKQLNNYSTHNKFRISTLKILIFTNTMKTLLTVHINFGQFSRDKNGSDEKQLFFIRTKSLSKRLNSRSATHFSGFDFKLRPV